jgi:CRISPR-associated protein Cas2
MTVIVLSRVPQGLRGDLAKWLLEVRPGVYAGRLTAAVRVRLWNRIIKYVKHGDATLVYMASNEQGYQILTLGDPSYRVRDFEGLQLIERVPVADGDA